MWFEGAVMSALLFGLTGFFMKISQMRKGSNSHLLLGLYISGSLGFLINALLIGLIVIRL